MSDVRRISEFLPEVLQTDVLRKFFAATADHMFQPDRVEYLNAYVGQLPSTYNPNKDARIPEFTQDRVDYQVEPGLVSRNTQSGAITHVLSYDDLINKLRWQGGLVDDHNRLFQAEYYSFGLPVDLDKFVNYAQYVWVPEGPQLIQLQSETNLAQIQQQATYTYMGTYKFVADGVTQTSTPLVFTTGLRVQFTKDINVNVRSQVYIVEGVGREISLVPDALASVSWDAPDTWDSTVWDGNALSEIPAYITIGRGSTNGNPWSRTNRWFHKQVLTISRTNLQDVPGHVAQRPILEFDPSIPLWNFGTQFLMDVNLVDTQRNTLADVIDKANVLVDGVRLDDGQAVLFTNLSDPALNNRIYLVSGVRSTGKVNLSMMTDSRFTNGLPSTGSVIFITQGDQTASTSSGAIYNNVGTNWYYTGSVWIKGQSRQLLPSWLPNSEQYVGVINQAPLFELFDAAGEKLGNNQKYPQSNFRGCTLLTYTQNSALPRDPFLGFPPEVDSASARNYQFDVTCTQLNVQYYSLNVLTTIPGYYYWQQTLQGAAQYVNNWFLSDTPTRQYVVNEYVAGNNQTTYTMDQVPDLSQMGLPGITVQVGASLLTSADYTVTGKQVILNQAPAESTVVKLRTYGGLHNQVTQGYFEIPLNLKANPDNQIITQFKMSDMLTHVHSVIQNQSGFTGNVQGANNWRDTAQLLGRGTQIVQHRASMLKLMAINSVTQSQVFEGSQSVTDPMAAMQWSQTEYLRYYNKFVNSLWNLYNNQALTGADSTDTWLSRSLRQINLGKTRTSAWVNSGFDLNAGKYCSQESVNPTWVPASATRLGAWSAWLPIVYYDTTQPKSVITGQHPLMMRCHNGALVALVDLQNAPLGQIAADQLTTSDPEQLTHPVARCWMRFEQLQYDSLPQKYVNVDHTCDLDIRVQFSGKFRNTSYTRSDLISLQAPAWNRWLTLNQVDALRNTTFDVRDPFSWNYAACVDADQQAVPGNWRGIYFYYYDTDQPHVSPWHMLGFSQKPTWWDTEYGAAPYTKGNHKLWQDLEQGRVRQGARSGTHTEWARPGLSKCVPVNDAGELLSPFEAGVVTQIPTSTQAAADWHFGDRGPAENVWLTSVDADQLWAQWGYLARPAAFVEYLWDGVRQEQLFGDQTYSQWVNSDTLTRKPLDVYVVHRENPSLILSLNSTLTYYGSCGIQHWISERLVSESRSITTYLGDLIRGAGVNLIHKMGGFTDGDNLRVLVDSFGLSNVDNLLLPQEDVTCQLLRSASIQEYVYTGVLVEFMGRNQGWRVIGYDPRDPFFEIIPSRVTGSKQTVVIEKQQVTEYKQGLNYTERVAYGTIFETRQQVYDFLISLGRAQEAVGWQFDEYDSTASKPRNWSLSAREFLYWSQGPWAAGTYITLSPAATLAKFKTSFGIIQHIGGLVNGTHSVTDRLGNLISLAELDFLRIEDEISVKVLNDQGIYALRLYTTSLEHALIFNNSTVFNDLVYDPLLNQRQLRFKLFGYRTLDWQGRLQAPGYLVTQSVSQLGNSLTVSNRIVPNLEKSVNDLRKIFEIDLSVPFGANNQTSVISQALPSNLLRIAQHQIGYQTRPYLNELLLDSSAEFQFYQGMIKQKGTSASIDALLRNTQVVQPDQEFYYFEEWAFRSGQYGYDSDVNQLDVILPQNQVTSNPQLVELLSDKDSDPASDNQITIVKNDARTVSSSGQLGKFKLRTEYGSPTTDLPTAGPVRRDEVTYQVVDQAELQALYEQVRGTVLDDPQARMMQPGDRVWQFVDPRRGWNVWKVCESEWQVRDTQPNQRDRTLTTVTSTSDHRLQDGDLVIIYGVVNAGVNVNGTFQVVNVYDTRTFDIDLSTTGSGSGGTAWQYASVRFSSETLRDRARIPGRWQRGDLSWVDGSSTQPWVIYVTSGRNWFETRRENLKTDLNYIQESRLYDLRSLQTLQMLALWDPVKNRIPGILDLEITYKTAYDPAQYTQDPTGSYGVNAPQAWGEAQVGQVWWDLSTTRYIDYEMGSDTERRQNWGRIAPRTTVDIYEWVRSPVPPTSWQDLVRANSDLTSIGSPGAASGEIKQADPPYVSRQQQTATGQLQEIYYFWVRNATTVPVSMNRKLSVRVIAQSLAAPENLGISWWAPISDSQTLIGNLGTYLNGDQTVWQTKWLNRYDVETVHREYELVSESDPRSSPPEWLWQKLGASLYEYDAYGNPLPDPRLKLLDTQGVLSRPRQATFVDGVQARRAVVQTVNNLLNSSSIPPLKDTSRQAWRPYFESAEAEPAQNNVQPSVVIATTPYVMSDVTTGRLNAYLQLDAQSGISQLLSAQPGALMLDQVTVKLGQRILIKNQNDTTHGSPAVNASHDLQAENGIYSVKDAGTVIVTTNTPLTDLENSPLFVITAPGAFMVSGREILAGEKIYLSAQSNTAQQGVYMLLSEGTSTVGATLQLLYSQDQVNADPTLLCWCVERVPELSSAQDMWRQLQVSVSQGATQSGTTWKQINMGIQQIDQDAIIFTQGLATPLYIQRVDNMVQLYELDYTLPFGSQVLVGAVVENQNKWTIWRWTDLKAGQAEWQLTRSQTYRTQNCWNVIDWYLTGYGVNTIPNYQFETLNDRDMFLGFVLGDIVKVNNTGNNTWSLFVKQDLPGEPWGLVGMQSGSLQLSDNLWDYATYNLGFDAQGFGSEIVGAEYDTRREFEQIWQGLWVGAKGTQGLLKIDSTVNEPNQLLFVLVNQALAEQHFVDWLFKTSFINMRGFAEVLAPTELYTENNINSLLAYINEIKPYHVKLRSFVDWRKASDTYTGVFTDFDKPPYADLNLGIRILDEDVPSDQVILSTDDRYTAWYNNFILNPALIRGLKTRMIYDRVSCATQVVYSAGYSDQTVPDFTCNSLAEWLDTILGTSVPVGTLVQVHVPGYTLMTRNTLQQEGLAGWDLLSWGLNYQGQISDTLYDIHQVLNLLDQPVGTGYTVRVYEDNLQTWCWYVKTQNTSSITDWTSVAYQAQTGAAQRIQDDYAPTSNQPPVDSAQLISGCESKLTTLSGKQFQTADAWDANVWDAVRGWDYTSSSLSGSDMDVNSGGNLKYQLFVGTGTQQEFVLKYAPQSPTELQVWVDGRKLYTPQDWQVPNQISQVLLVNTGVGYSINDVLQVQGGQYVSATKLKVMGVSVTGAITQLIITEPGVYVVAPMDNVLPVTGGSGINATVTVRWSGSTLRFTQTPGEPTQPRPNIWVIEKGETFNPGLATLLDTTIDGAGLNRPHLEGDHPEELVPVWPRHNLIFDVYTAGTGGQGIMHNQVYESDGIRTHFPLPAPVAADQQIWVYVNGELQTHGITADYVINYQYPQVVFVNAPASGRVNIHQIGWGGATPGIGDFSISAPGANYQLYDQITLDAGVPSASRARADVTAVSAVDVQVVYGGQSYQIGDQLLYKFGTGTQSLVVQVMQIKNEAGRRGVIDQIQIIKPGYYTDLSVNSAEWFTTGSGTGANMTAIWGVANLFITNRGALLTPSQQFTQVSVLSVGGDPGVGMGITLTVNTSYIRQQVILQGDGVTNNVNLTDAIQQNTVWVTFNGTTTFNWSVDPQDNRNLKLGFMPVFGDVVNVNVYRSSLYSVKNTQTVSLALPQLTYTLLNPPAYSVAQSLNTQVFVNGMLIRGPEYCRFVGDNTQTIFSLGTNVNDPAFVKVWINSVLQAPFSYTFPSTTQIEFFNAPASASDILIEIMDTVVPNHDYTVSEDQITFVSGVLAPLDHVEVITFSEDSSIQWAQDRFVGTIPPVYSLNRHPTDFGSVQVYVDGVKQDAMWDYKFVQVSGQVQVQFSPTHTHSGLNQIDVYYVVSTPAKPPVAFRMFENIFGDRKFYRLSDKTRTRLSESTTWDATNVWVQDGTQLPPATLSQPGVIWVGTERLSYTQITPDPVQEFPRRYKLSGLSRGVLGTSTGVFSDMQVEFYNGDGETILFMTAFDNPIVKVNDQEQVLNLNYEILLNPPGVVPGTYVRFLVNTQQDNIPPPGDRNICMIHIRNSVISGQISHDINTQVVDGSKNQEIPAGYIWPYGNQGIQYGLEPQTDFLIAEPGTRIR